MNQKPKQRALPAFAALAALLLFALCVICVLLSGAGVYGRLVREGEASYTRRSCVQYLSTKLRQSASPEQIWLEDFGSTQALVLGETIDGTDYVTRVYCHDGWLRELFTRREGDFAPEDGEKLLPAEALNVTLEDGFLTAEVAFEAAEPASIAWKIRDGGGFGP